MTTTPGREAAKSHRVRDWFGKLITFWTLIAVVSGIAISIFADLGEDVASKSTTALDSSVRAWVMSHQNPIIYRIAYVLTWIGSPAVMVLLAVMGGSGVVLYLVAWVIVPVEDAAPAAGNGGQ